jgi:transcriptional regulator with XRE-family HTH domain
MGFRENLRRELAYSGLLVKELAARSGISKRTLDNYLNTRNYMPSADIAVNIARALGVSVEYLVTGHDSRAKPRFPANPSIRLVLQILEELDEGGRETLLGVARVLQKQTGGGRTARKR